MPLPSAETPAKAALAYTPNTNGTTIPATGSAPAATRTGNSPATC